MVSREEMKKLMEKWESNKESMDEVVGFIVRKSYENTNERHDLDYEEVYLTIKYLKQYFSK